MTIHPPPQPGMPGDYEERVYAGVLGKIIAVYLGRPYEGWTYERVMAELGEITCYVNHRTDIALKNHTLVVTDDDISGTFVFPRALRDHGLDPTPAQVAQTWLDYLIESKAVLWWGGLGNSTEHTAYLRLRSGIPAPRSGSAVTNGTVVSEQVGAEIFIEGFAMTCPGDPEKAADLVARAASVSHDGEALQAARVIAALVAHAFTEPDVDRLLDTATSLIDKRSLIHAVIEDVRGWVAADPSWHETRRRIEDRYGYHKYGGNCHVVPNHAVVISALARSGGEFGEAMTIVNTSGWDTDSNAGNVGAIAGVRGGLAGLDAGPQDWRGPIADRMYLPSADGGEVITDAAREALTLAGYGRARYGHEPVRPKDGARFHFALPGSLQGFGVRGAATVTSNGGALTIEHQRGTATVATPTFFPPDAETTPIYGMVASPTLYSGQLIRAAVQASGPVTCRLFVRHYDGGDDLVSLDAGPVRLGAGQDATLRWTVPDTGGQPIAEVGITLDATGPGTVRLEYLTWDGAPDVNLTRPADGGTMWRRAWVDAVDQFNPRWPEPFRIVQNRGTGMLITGSRDWHDYEVTADLTPHLAAAAGLAARVQGLYRYYAIELGHDGTDRTLRLVRALGERTVLASRPFSWEFGRTYQLRIRVEGTRVVAWADDLDLSVDDEHAAEPTTSARPDAPAGGPGCAPDCGSVALLVTEGRTATQAVRVTPIERELAQQKGS